MKRISQRTNRSGWIRTSNKSFGDSYNANFTSLPCARKEAHLNSVSLNQKELSSVNQDLAKLKGN